MSCKTVPIFESLFIGRAQPRDKSIILSFASYKNICDVAVVSS